MEGAQSFLQRLSPKARIGFGIGLLLIALLIASLAWWVFHPRYGLLFGHVRQRNAAEIVQALDQWHVPYRTAARGTALLVPADQVYPTRMKLASSGIPNGGVVGFALFDHSNYGITQFAQRVNFLRALQGELERTIDSLSEVDSARVHLTLQQTGLFAQSTQPAKGSVTVWLRRGRHLDAEQVAGIQRLVASAVEGLKPQAVVVLDQQGDMLSGAGPDGLALGDATARAIEAHLTRRAQALLADALHSNRFSVSVSVRLDYDRTKQVRNELLPQGRDGNGLIARETHALTPGVPSADGSSAGSPSSSTEVEYAHSSEQIETIKAAGRIERISVGVVIPASVPPSVVDQLRTVLAAGLGLEPQRGDSIDIATFAATAAPRTRITTPPSLRATPSPVAAPHTVAIPPASTDARITNRSAVLVAWLLGSVLLLILLGSWLRARHRSASPRLTPAQREQILARIHHWINEAERAL